MIKGFNRQREGERGERGGEGKTREDVGCKSAARGGSMLCSHCTHTPHTQDINHGYTHSERLWGRRRTRKTRTASTKAAVQKEKGFRTLPTPPSY